MARESESRRVRASTRRTPEIRSENILADRRRTFFRTVAKHAYPRETAPNVRALTKGRYGESTIYDWMRGTSDAPIDVYIKLIAEILAG